jgi:hypothetical protein
MARAALVCTLVLLAGCTLLPLSEADCKSDDWRSRGYADGYAGHPRQDMRLIPECRSRYGLEIDRAHYLEGWARGHDEWDRLIGSMDRRR